MTASDFQPGAFYELVQEDGVPRRYFPSEFATTEMQQRVRFERTSPDDKWLHFTLFLKGRRVDEHGNEIEPWYVAERGYHAQKVRASQCHILKPVTEVTK
jgi:hypothetical protein